VAVGVEGSGADLRRRGEILAKALGLLFAEVGRCVDCPVMLVLTERRLELRERGRGKVGPVHAEFIGGRMGHRRKSIRSSERLLAKAVGFKGRPLAVCDATAGLGRDAFVLACLGCTVTAVERSPVIAALLTDGLERAGADPAVAEIIARRLRLLVGDARVLLPRLPENERPDVVYLDPMFPSRRKSAAVKKEMRICRLVAGDDADAGELLAIARTVARSRVVAKRPVRAPHLGGEPEITYRGTTIRYDVYLPAKGERSS
jgi:16S rRNA (guanine1516-N2)-methyltransferase